MPSIADLAQPQSTVDTFNFKQQGEAMGYGRAAKILPTCCAAAYPELDWAPFFDLANAIEACADVNTHGRYKGRREAALQFAAQLWRDGLKKIEAGADALRSREGNDGDAPDRAICGADFKSWLDGETRQSQQNLELFAKMFQIVDKGNSQHAPPGGGAHKSTANSSTTSSTINDAMPAWNTQHRDKCIFHFCHKNGCKLKDKCSMAESHKEPTDEAWVADFKAQNGL